MEAPEQRQRAGGALLLALAVAVIAVSIGGRVAYRRFYYTGWEILGPAHGQYLLATRPFAEAVQTVLRDTRHFQYWTGVSSLLSTLVPGLLGQLLPWEYWAHLLSFATLVAAVALLARGAGVARADVPYLMLGVAASPTLLSFSIIGAPYMSGLLPHAMAIAITQSLGCRRRWWLSLLLAILTVEVSWHGYGFGKTHFVVFLAGALLLVRVPWRTRAAWVAASVLQVYQLWVYERTSASGYLVSELGRVFTHAGEGAGRLAFAMYLSASLDVPVLALLGLLGFFAVYRDRLFWRLIYLLQLGPLVIMMLTGEHTIPPRRFVGGQLYNLLMLALLLGRMRAAGARAARRVVLALLLVGAGVQLDGLWRFTRTPVEQTNRSLPYTEWGADFFVTPWLIDVTRYVVGQVEAGKTVVLLYNFDAYAENTTDPNAIIERIYLHLGHRRFVDSVRVFGDRACRYACLPIIPLSKLDESLAVLPRLDDVVLLRYTDSSETFNHEADGMLATIGARYDLVPQEGTVARAFTVYTLRAKAS